MNIHYIPNAFKANIELPASKSISNRILIIQALCADLFEIENLSKAHDTILLQELLEKVKIYLSISKKEAYEVLKLDVQDAGTAFRFLTAFLSLQEGGAFLLTGGERLLERPIAELVEALQSIGADIQYLGEGQDGPLLIKGKKFEGSVLQVDGSNSSQFVSALCLIAPCLENGLQIKINGHLVSENYVFMTLGIMKEFGIKIDHQDDLISIAPQKYIARNYVIENDWSSASFFYAMSMMMEEAQINLNGLHENSLQGDAIIQEIAKDFGIETHFFEHGCQIKKSKYAKQSIQTEYNFSHYPDMAIPIIVASALKYPHIRIRGIHHLELKESKRITVLKEELSKIGIQLIYDQEILSFEQEAGFTLSSSISFHTHHDHRIAMSMSMLCLMHYSVSLDDSDCVKKSFPGFFDEIKKLGMENVEST
jgi:3-phosphoshikimate 1-carboxyvinyltransferase